jgi:hypothetical protein
MLEEGTEHAPIEIRAHARSVDDRTCRPSADLRMADRFEERPGGEQGAAVTQAGEKPAAIDCAHGCRVRWTFSIDRASGARLTAVGIDVEDGTAGANRHRV